MTHDEKSKALAVAKDRLIKEGELYRVSVLHAKMQLANALHPDALMHGAVDHAVGIAQARLGALLAPGGLSGVNFKSVLPYAMTLGSFMARKRLIKPVLIVGTALAAVGAWLIRRKRST